MELFQPFNPKWGSNKVLTAAASAANTGVDINTRQVRVINTGAAIAYVCTYSSTGTARVATVADLPVNAGERVIFTKDVNDDMLSYISATGSTLQVMTGTGS